jgi:hypothetical protein
MHSTLVLVPLLARASVFVTLAVLATACSRSTLTVKPSVDSGTKTDRSDSAGLDTTGLTDTADVGEAMPSTCAFLDTKREAGANLVSDPSGCPATLADLPSRCGQNLAQLVRCRDYVWVEFPPDPPGGSLPGTSTCYYTPDGASLMGGMVVSNVYTEDAFPMTAGKLPQGCEDTCGAVESVCPD